MDRTNRNEDKPSRIESQQNPPTVSSRFIPRKQPRVGRKDKSAIDLEKRLLTMTRNGGNYIYFIRCGECVKVGWTAQVGKRIGQLRAANPCDIYLVGLAPGGIIEEARLHRELERFRIRGEWFRLTREVVRVIHREGYWPMVERKPLKFEPKQLETL